MTQQTTSSPDSRKKNYIGSSLLFFSIFLPQPLKALSYFPFFGRRLISAINLGKFGVSLCFGV